MSGAPVPVYARAADNTVVQVGTAYPLEDGFEIQLGALTTGKPIAVPAAGAPGAVLPPYGRSKGMPILGAPAGDLKFYANGCRRTLGDPAKSKFHEKERGTLAALQAEMKRQGIEDEGAQSGPPDDGAPPASDSSLPF